MYTDEILSNILGKILSECSFLEADRILISGDGQDLKIQTFKSTQILQSYRISNCELGFLKEFFIRSSGSGSMDTAVTAELEVNNRKYSFSVEQAGQNLVVSEINVLELSSLMHHGSPMQAKTSPLVLIVEDDLDQCRLLEMMLKDMNYQVLVAANGEEGLTVTSEHAPDLIISDLMMPKMDGSEFVRKIKRNPAYQNIPILILTALSDSEKEFSLLNLGVDDYCHKSMPRKVLMKRVENLISRHMQAI